MDKPFAQTAREAEIVQYADEHLELSQEEIAKHFGIGRTSVSRVLVLYRPDRPKLRPGGIEAKITREIRDYKRLHPDMGAQSIADEMGYSRHRVLKALDGMERAKAGRKHKEATVYTLKPCLKCGKPHKSTWAGDRIHPQCKESMVYQYIPNHSVYVEGNGRV